MTTRCLQFAMLTDVGCVRAHNEDACAADEAAGVFVVCDGMGGHAGGEIAANMAAHTFMEEVRSNRESGPEQRLVAALKEANRRVFQRWQKEHALSGMGTTLVALEVDWENACAWVIHAGDSRCYRLRAGLLQRLTQDHSYVDEQLRMGMITEDEAAVSCLRNMITRAVGFQSDVVPDVASFALEEGDLFLLCSDGLSCEVSADQITSVLNECGADDLHDAVQTLVKMANQHGGRDNITVTLVRV